jgi:hypothetical protein
MKAAHTPVSVELFHIANGGLGGCEKEDKTQVRE